MQRRLFLKNTALISAGIVVFSGFVSCSGENIVLDDIIGKPENLMNDFPKSGNDFLSYYEVSKSSFTHTLIDVDKVYIYCQEGQVVGYIIRVDGVDKVGEYTNTLAQLYGNQENVYVNDFGEEYERKSDIKKIKLGFSKQFENIPQYTFYSESTLNNKLFLF